MLYLTKKDKIDYIRDYYSDILFNIIKAGFIDIDRKISDDYCYYYIVKEVIDLLDNLYRTYNPMAEVDVILYNPDFYIKYETFDLFLAKFTTTIAPLELIDI